MKTVGEKRRLLMVLVLVFGLIAGCGQAAPTVRPTEPPATAPKTAHLESMPFISNPLDPDIRYAMRFNGRDTEAAKVLAGDYWRHVSIWMINGRTGGEKRLIEDLPFIELAKWSPDGRYLGLMGEETLYLWDRHTGKLTTINREVNTPSVTGFGFGPDNVVYTEHANLPNDAIYNPSTRTGKSAWQIGGETLYYKDDLGKGYYVATVCTGSYDKMLPEQALTVIADKSGKIHKELIAGRYRDHHGKSLIQVGEERFGLYYIPDYSREETREIYPGFVYQTAFTPDGRVLFTVPATNQAAYQLCLFDPVAGTTRTYQVSGPHFALDPVGRTISIGGWKEERFELQSMKLISQVEVPARPNDQVQQALFGAVSLYTHYYCHPAQKVKDLEDWFVNTAQPVPQTALFDVTDELTRRKDFTTFYGDYLLQMKLEELEVKDDRASARVGVGVSTASGSGWGYEGAYELVRQQGRWKVTGLSTFPESGERQRVAAVAANFCQAAQRGDEVLLEIEGSDRVYGLIRGHAVKIGQIQFWRMSEPHLSPDVETANHAKVYLEVEGRRYKLLLEKKGYFWKATGLSDRNLSSLF